MSTYPIAEEAKEVQMTSWKLRERLQEKLERAKRNVENIEHALKLMDENPEFEKFHDAVTRIGY